ncbi:MAG TPA: dethiobiotin synthase [Kiritimatiellia bacterium]|nr:dethiobiotin synthase [Kiritimatiellia bacterium]
MAKRFFITGTDTGVGKTWVTSCLMAALRQRDIMGLAIKPIQTGSDCGMDDASAYGKLSGCADINIPRPLYDFPLPASPHLAAHLAGRKIELEKVLEYIDKLSRQVDVLIIEGAGGLLTPLDAQLTMLDLLTSSEARPVLVTRTCLGTLNHTALTLRELLRAGHSPCAIVANDTAPAETEEDTLIKSDNLEHIALISKGAPVIHFPFVVEPSASHALALGNLLADALI